MRLHGAETLFQQAIKATSEFKNIPEIFIEKDYWVTYALSLIFNEPIGEDTVFKGGTVKNVLVGVCDCCDSVAVLPHQSTPAVKKELGVQRKVY